MKVSLISLGCPKNQVAAEQMLAALSAAGHEITSDPAEAEAVVVNTCAFIEDAKQEAIDTLLEAAELKNGRLKTLLCAGCLAQLYGGEVMAELPEVDGVVGVGSCDKIAAALESAARGERPVYMDPNDAPVQEAERLVCTGPAWAYLLIAEGCDNRCSYCLIPSIRGPFRSRPMPAILDEARSLAARGYKEIILVAQDLTHYGADFKDGTNLAALLRELCAVDGLEWLRLHYLYPHELNDELIEVIASEPKIVKYLDIPIQHINDEILRKMNRRDRGADIRALLKKLRARIPGLVLRTSLITGLPGEGEAEFEELCEFLREARIERAGVFPLSPEEGTPAAKMPHVDTETARERAETVLSLQAEIMDEWESSLAGSVIEAMCDEYDPETGTARGRAYFDSPGVDGSVVFPGPCMPGSIVQLRVLSAEDGELRCELILPRQEALRMKLTTASKITIVRMLLIPVVLVLMYLDFEGHMYFALAAFVIASVSDFADGYIARHYNQVTNFGKFLDPLADKLLVISVLLVFVDFGLFPAWAAIIVVARELAIQGLRMIAVEGGKVIAAAWSGKIKTASTMVCFVLLMLPIPDALVTACWIVVLATTVYSGLEYFVKNASVFKG